MFKTNLQFFSKSNKELEEEVKALKAKLSEGAITVNTADAEAIAAKIIEDAKADAAKIIEDAQAELDELTSGVATTPLSEEQTQEEFLEERVPVMLYKDGDRYKDDVTIAVNGDKIQIQRGKQVWIKRKHAMVLESQYRQQMLAADLSTQLVDEFKGREKQLS